MQGTLSTLIMHCYSVYADPKLYSACLEPKLTIVLVGKDLVLEGLSFKTEDYQRFQEILVVTILGLVAHPMPKENRFFLLGNKWGQNILHREVFN